MNNNSAIENKCNNKLLTNSNGFTLVELLAVLIIMAVILVLVIPGVSKIIQSSAKSSFAVDAKELIKQINYKKLGDKDFNPPDITKANMQSMLGVSDENYKEVTVTMDENKVVSVVLVGQNDWDGYIAYGTYDDIKVVDSNSYNGDFPVITITGTNPITIYSGSTYTDAGATATDSADGDLTNKISVTSNVNPSIPGSYNVVYKVSDSSGNETIIKRVVNVLQSYANTGYVSSKGVNAPVLSAGMTPVKWDAGNNEITTTASDPNWYDYTSKKWANAKTKDGSYWVWIPRYAYKITSGYHSSTTGTIDIKFLKGSTNITNDNTKIETSGYQAGIKDTATDYFTHPAFYFEGNILGFWVAKYEPTAVEGVANGYTADSSCPTVGDNVTTKTVKIVPNAISWRCIDAKNSYNLSLNMKNNIVYGWNSSQVEPHTMKNTEWGAIAYLTQSTYGANAEVWINNSNNYTTGCAANSVNQGASTTGCLNAYNTANGVKASTTSNIAGVYDMSGGAWERTMGNYNNLGASSGFTNTDVTNLPNKYINRYTTISANLLNGVGMNYDSTIYGDAIYETSSDAARYNGSSWIGLQNGAWYTDQSLIPWSSAPWFYRGGSFNAGSNAGLLIFSNSNGGAYSHHSFRPIIIVIG